MGAGHRWREARSRGRGELMGDASLRVSGEGLGLEETSSGSRLKSWRSLWDRVTGPALAAGGSFMSWAMLSSGS